MAITPNGRSRCSFTKKRRGEILQVYRSEAHVKGSAIILQLKGDHPIWPKINAEPAAIITMHLMMMLLLLWHALVK